MWCIEDNKAVGDVALYLDLCVSGFAELAGVNRDQRFGFLQNDFRGLFHAETVRGRVCLPRYCGIETIKT